MELVLSDVTHKMTEDYGTVVVSTVLVNLKLAERREQATAYEVMWAWDLGEGF